MAGAAVAAGNRGSPISAMFASHAAREEHLLLPVLERSATDPAALLAREPHLAGTQSAA